jgi:hypothetical protein
MRSLKYGLSLSLFILAFALQAQDPIDVSSQEYLLYPEVNEGPLALPSPLKALDGQEYVIALTRDSAFAIIPVTLSDQRGICRQLVVDTADFPSLVTTGLHDEEQLMRITHITGRSLAEINRLALPGGLSTGGFIAPDENIKSVLLGDNRLVRKMNLSHPLLAKCLFHVLNLMDEDLKLDRWNMAHHEWEHILGFWYSGKFVQVRAFDTKGGQESIFDDGITGAFHIKIWRDLNQEEKRYLEEHYAQLSPERFDQMIEKLTFFNMGEMQAQYIMRYGFYEGHTFWRSDPVAIAFIFGLKELEELDRIFEGQLDLALLHHFND